MSVDIQVPRLAESISEAVLVEWLREDGVTVRADEPVATLETDKAAVEIAAPEAGVLHHARSPGDRVVVGDVLARIDSAAAATSVTTAAPVTAAALAPADGGARAADAEPAAPPLSPAVRRLLEEQKLAPGTIPATGRGGRLLKEDVLRHLERGKVGAAPEAGAAPASPAPPEAGPPAAPATPAPVPRPAAVAAAPTPEAPAPAASQATEPGSDERVVPMGRIRQRIAERLVQAQRSAAILTTFNEIDMGPVMDLRARHKERFEKVHGVRLGFMSFFTRAAVLALAEIPEINAEIRGTDIVYHGRVHMGIAVQTDRGLMVPVVRNADTLDFAGIEREIERLAVRAREHRVSLEELMGGTFTISNGGIYGSLLSTPILNPPQSGILGMHKIEQRPVAVGDAVEIRPMMYVALSYDHRIVDGQQAVTFLVRIKERLEDPERMMLAL